MALSMQDQNILAGWIAGGASLADVQNASSVGIVGNTRFSENARRRFCLIWEWSVFRFSSQKQETFWNRHGKAAFYRRMNRVRKLANHYGSKLEPMQAGQ